ncbi:MAG: translocation/assembly module TamB domain-containing protein, partial [Psychrobium sp.]|nr:translocation/assembly module TamB domain-containing protein [Psychrobium sp.]
AGKLDAHGTIDLYSYFLRGGLHSEHVPALSLTAAGDGSFSHLDIKKSDIAILDGQVNLQGVIDWSSQLTWHVKAVVKQLQPSSYWPDYQGNVNGTIDSKLGLGDNHWQVDITKLDIYGNWQHQPLKLIGGVSGQSDNTLPYGRWTFDNLTLSNGNNNANINGTIDKHLNLSSVINLPEINDSYAPISGSIVGKLSLSGTIEQPLLDYQILVHNFVYHESENDSEEKNNANNTLEIGKISSKGSLQLEPSKPVNIDLELTNLRFAQQTLHKATLSLTGSQIKHQLHLRSRGDPLALNMMMRGSYQNDKWQGSLERAVSQLAKWRWQLVKPLALELDRRNKTLSIAQHCWRQLPHENTVSSKTRLCLENDFEFDAAHKSSNLTKLSLKHFSLTDFNEFLPNKAAVAGEVNIELNFTLAKAQPWQVIADAVFSNTTVSGEYEQKQITHDIESLTLSLILNQQFSNATLTMKSPQLGDLYVTVLSDLFSDNPSLTGHVQSQGFKLAPYQDFLPDIANLTGEVNISTGFSGTLRQPLFFGHANISNANIESPKLSSQLSDLTTNLIFKGQNATLASHFNLGQGKGSINGTIDWQQEPRAQLTFTGQQLSLTPTKGVDLVFSPQLDLALAQSGVIIRGDVVVDSGEIKIKKMPQSAIGISDDIVIVSQQTQKTTTLDLDINLLISDNLSVNALGLTSMVSGQLNLVQNIERPLGAYGNLTLADATYQAMGQSMIINNGTLIFTGVLNNPIVNIEAIRDPYNTNDNVIAGLYVTGFADSPTLTIFSKPALVQQEALSYLLNGRSNGDSGTWGENMAVAMLLNGGLGQTSKLIDNLGDSLGVDQLTVQTVGVGDATKVQVSGYIGPKLQLRYGVGIFDAQPEVGLRYQLTPKLFVEFINNTNQALNFLYRITFD